MSGKRLWGLAAVLLVLLLPGCGGESRERGAAQERVTWQLTLAGEEDSSWMEAAEYFGTLLSDATDGAVTVVCCAESGLTEGVREDAIRAVMDGTVDLCMDTNLMFSTLDSRFAAVTMPFLFPDADTAAAVLDGPGGAALDGCLEALGLHGLGYGENGFRQLTTGGRAVTAPEDLRGLTVRTAGSMPLVLAYEDCWGADHPVSSWSEPLIPLERGFCDGQESPLTEADRGGYQTAQTDVTVFPAFYEAVVFAMNGDLYDALSPELRETVDQCGREAAAYQRQRNREREAEILKRWEGEDGLAVHTLTAAEVMAFQTLTERLYDPADPAAQKLPPEITPEWLENFRET